MHCLELIMAVADILLLCCLSDRPFARWRHFTTSVTVTAIILQGIVFLCELRLSFLNLTGMTKFEHERRNEMNSGLSSEKTSRSR